ncbi:MAG: hypothetical protein FJY55_11510 [Betaproteobacteria bacterium]|nr:hypothetical protein [Betaproteobacteria bacterium]
MEPDEWCYVEQEAQILLAGEMADKLFSLEDSKGFSYEVVGGDRADVRFLASKIFHSAFEADEWIANMEKKADALVRKYEKAIEALASELVTRQTLPGSVATNILCLLTPKEEI